jgi:hypothetical protein
MSPFSRDPQTAKDPQREDGAWGTDNGEPQRSAATPAWKPQRICKGKIDAMQAKSITGGQVRDDKADCRRSQF